MVGNVSSQPSALIPLLLSMSILQIYSTGASSRQDQAVELSQGL